MNYRQWKKNYKKRHGVNPPIELDKRKQRRLAKKAIKNIGAIDWGKTINNMATLLSDALAEAMRTIGRGFDRAGTVCKDVADNLQKLEIKGCYLNWEVKDVVGDYGVYENNALNGSSQLKLITNSRKTAQKIVELMQQDQLEHYRLNYPERVQRHTAAVLESEAGNE